ncbi:NTE family protein [Gammaproteobacteria bacterium]
MELKNLIIQGGSIKGIATTGALQYMHEIGILDKIENYAGTSIGGVLCFLLVIGYTPKDIKDIVFSKDFNVILNDAHPWLYPYNLMRKYGVNTGYKFIKLLEELLINKKHDKNITFKELYAKTNKTLVVTGTNITKKKTVFFNWHTYPNMKVLEALRITISIPFFFTVITFENDIYVDGGILMNYPLYYFEVKNSNKEVVLCKDSSEFNDRAKSISILATTKYTGRTVGIRTLDALNEEETDEISYGSETITNISSYIKATISTILTELERRNIKEYYWERSITINLPYNLKITDFNPKKEIKDDMGRRGYEEAKDFFINK